MKTNVGIVGVSGNGGRELVRYLSAHPQFNVTNVYGNKSAGESLDELFPRLPQHMAGIVVESWPPASPLKNIDLIFLSLPTGKSAEAAKHIPYDTVIVDLGGDHRFRDGWIYNIPEVTRRDLLWVKRVANPGCYPTAAMLALAPLLKYQESKLDFESITIFANSGLSGKARGGGEDKSTFSDMNEDTSAYNVTGHVHTPEIKKAIEGITGKSPLVTFIPNYVPMNRGISVCCVIEGPYADYESIAREFYATDKFVRVVNTPPHTKWASGTNVAYVSYAHDSLAGKVIALCTIDNLGKGAAGQAIQNANLVFGLDPSTGLEFYPL